MLAGQIYFWKQMPFVRLLLPFIVGIILQYYFRLPTAVAVSAALISVVLLFTSVQLRLNLRYKLRWLSGISINILLVAAGGLMVQNKDIKNESNWIGHYLQESRDTPYVLVTLKEPLVEKAKSFKAEAAVAAVNDGEQWHDAKGNILVYISKDSGRGPSVTYGSQLIFRKPLQPIKNSGNPGAFDYQQYNGFRNIYHQVYLKDNDYQVTGNNIGSAFRKRLFAIRSYVVNVLENNIEGEREQAISEAILIGYQYNLDKDLVQAYSNTGVVHVIAISGLHLGLIYGLLVLLLKPFRKVKGIRLIKPVVILLVLWLFTLLAGAAPSILRSAVMFSFIVLGEAIDKRTSIYNTLAVSAFVMLCINPFYLWDIGFQLSYAAVLSIVLFANYVYNWFYFDNKLLNFFWRMLSVTLAAQILTIPITFYSFHQFPNLFLIANFLVLPISELVLILELFLVLLSWIPFILKYLGLLTSKVLSLMNGTVDMINHLPGAVTDNIQNSILQTILLYVVIIAGCAWLINKKKQYFVVAFTAIFLFTLIDSFENFQLRSQHKIVVYNVPKNQAVDFMEGKEYSFVGDTEMISNDFLRNFHLKPSRTMFRVKEASVLPNLFISLPFVQFRNKRLLVVDKPYKFESSQKVNVDAVVISKNPRLYITDLISSINSRMYVFDGSNSFWRVNKWKRDCDSLHLPYHATADKGAFILDAE